MPKQIPKVGDVFCVKLADDSCALGQVLEIEPIVMNSITCGFFDHRFNEIPEEIEHSVTASENLLACHFVTRDLFNKGKWPRISNSPPVIPKEVLPYRETESQGWIGAKVIGSSNITSFLNAYFGLGDWNEMKDPLYYQKLLLEGRSGPKTV